MKEIIFLFSTVILKLFWPCFMQSIWQLFSREHWLMNVCWPGINAYYWINCIMHAMLYTESAKGIDSSMLSVQEAFYKNQYWFLQVESRGNFLIVKYYFSKWFTKLLVSSNILTAIISAQYHLFAEYWLPEIVASNSGSAFISVLYKIPSNK